VVGVAVVEPKPDNPVGAGAAEDPNNPVGAGGAAEEPNKPVEAGAAEEDPNKPVGAGGAAEEPNKPVEAGAAEEDPNKEVPPPPPLPPKLNPLVAFVDAGPLGLVGAKLNPKLGAGAEEVPELVVLPKENAMLLYSSTLELRPPDSRIRWALREYGTALSVETASFSHKSLSF
jgi:hypothetical protein